MEKSKGKSLKISSKDKKKVAAVLKYVEEAQYAKFEDDSKEKESEKAKESETPTPTVNKCPKCGWVLSSNATECPRCKISEEKKEEKPEEKKISVLEQTQQEIKKLNEEIFKIQEKIGELDSQFSNQQISQEDYLNKKNYLYTKMGEIQGKIEILKDVSFT